MGNLVVSPSFRIFARRDLFTFYMSYIKGNWRTEGSS